MKIRNGFVSNSSSSSFLIIGTKVKIEDVKNLNNPYIAVGPLLNEGNDVIDINDYETLYVISQAKDLFDIYLVEETDDEPDMASRLELTEDERWNMDSEEMSELYKKKFKKDCVFLSKDYCCSEGYYDLIERHGLDVDPDKVEENVQKYYREQKLSRILK